MRLAQRSHKGLLSHHNMAAHLWIEPGAVEAWGEWRLGERKWGRPEASRLEDLVILESYDHGFPSLDPTAPQMHMHCL